MAFLENKMKEIPTPPAFRNPLFTERWGAGSVRFSWCFYKSLFLGSSFANLNVKMSFFCRLLASRK